jgi:glycosyltransferase involved in cell wall biosynthesis
MKILYISAYPPARDGIADYTKRLSDSIEKLGNSTVVIAPKSIAKNVYPNVHRILGFGKADISSAINILRSEKPNVVHVQFCLSMYGLNSFVIYYLLLKVKKADPKCLRIITLHELQREQERIGIFAILFYKVFLRIFDGYIVHTEQSRKNLIKAYKKDNSAIQLIRFPIFEFSDKKLKASHADSKFKLKDKYVVLLFGFIQVDKGTQYLLEAINSQKLLKLRKRLKVVIAGDVRKRNGLFKYFGKKDEQYKESLKSYIAKNNLVDQVIMTGFVDSADVFSLFDRADAIVIPYTKIEHSSVLGMSLAAQKPIIASDVGGIGETLKGYGILASPGNAGQIAEGLYVLSNHPTIGQRLVSSYESIVGDSNQQNVSKVTLQFINNLLATNDKNAA